MNTVFPSPALLHEAENFTLFIKNSISFPRFKVNRFVGKEGGNAGGLTQLQPLSAHCLPPSRLLPSVEAAVTLREQTSLEEGYSIAFLRAPSAE